MKKKFFIISIILTILFASGLRLINLGKFPPSLYWEEAALGYDAYSILKTGKDFHGNPFPIVAFQSFGDFKPSGYFYAAVISEFFLGLNEIAVRLPSALAGIGIVVLGMLIAKEIFEKEKQRNLLILISGLVISISPWALQFSRAAFEANLATFFSCLGIWLLLKVAAIQSGSNSKKDSIALRPRSGLQNDKKGFYLPAAAIAFATSMYTYHSSRIFIPLLLTAYVLLFWRVIKKQWKWVIAAAFLGSILILPIILKIKDPQVSHRFQETSAFMEPGPIIRINQLREAEGNTLVSRIIHHRYWYYSGVFLRNLFSHFDPNYLFINGDSNLRHSTGQTGIFYPIDALFLLVGLVLLTKDFVGSGGDSISASWRIQNDNKVWFLILWWILALVPAGLTKAVPHALRTLLAVPAPQLIIGYGIAKFFGVIYHTKNKSEIRISKFETIFKFKCSKFKTFRSFGFKILDLFRISDFVLGIFLIIYIFFTFHHLYDYFGDYSRRSSSAWQYGYKEMINYVFQNKEKYEKIYITRELGRPSMYYWFYAKTNPKKVQQINDQVKKDQGEYLEFENIKFWLPARGSGKSKSLVIVAGKSEIQGKLIKKIKNLNNEVIFRAYEI